MQAKDPIIEELKYTALQINLAEKNVKEYTALRDSAKNKNDYDGLIESLEELQEAYREKMKRILNGQF